MRRRVGLVVPVARVIGDGQHSVRGADASRAQRGGEGPVLKAYLRQLYHGGVFRSPGPAVAVLP